LLYWWAVRRGGLEPAASEATGALPEAQTAVQPYDPPQARKAIASCLVLVVLFFTPIPRELSVLGIAAVLLTSRKLTTGQFLGLVDWPLLVLFVALFVLVEGFQAAGGPSRMLAALTGAGIELHSPLPLALTSIVLSNLVSNVPAVMLLLGPVQQGGHEAGYLLALTSTYAGNLLLIGSIANLIVATQAARDGVRVTAGLHASWTAPLALLSLGIAVGWWSLLRALV
jgi:Na+/H+ antiporter NhaD/arsenite permease-like protein